jgi:hypothetical protein
MLCRPINPRAGLHRAAATARRPQHRRHAEHNIGVTAPVSFHPASAAVSQYLANSYLTKDEPENVIAFMMTLQKSR